MRAAVVILAVGLVLLGAAFARQAAPVADNSTPEPDDTATVSSDPGGWTDDAGAAVDSVNPFAQMEQSAVSTQTQDPNVSAFLAMIQTAEGTARERDPYAVCYGYTHTIADFSDHPKLTGEWPGVSIADLGPEYAGQISTAAGAYQIIRKTWQGCKRALALPDFSPASQDAAAVYLIREAGALDLVREGRFDEAVALCKSQWASLPGANATGQKMRKLSDLRAAYQAAGGYIA